MLENNRLNPLELAVVDILGNETKSQKQVCDELFRYYNVIIKERALRDVYKNIRRKFADNQIDFTICHSKRGNFISRDAKTIKKDNANCRGTAFALLKYSYARDRRLKLIGQMSLKEYANMIIATQEQEVKGAIENE